MASIYPCSGMKNRNDSRATEGGSRYKNSPAISVGLFLLSQVQLFEPA